MLLSCSVFAQTGSLQGTILDGELPGSPLPFADVFIKGTTKGTTTDFDGNYSISGIDVGTYSIVISFVGYETKEVPNVVIEDGATTTLNEELKVSAAALSEVVVEATTEVKESEKALILEQKKAEVVVESIGSEQLAKVGASDASAATEKIAGVSKSQSSSEVYIRGLGDRYLSTTLNGLPVPSDDIERKNINLNLFNTNVIQNVSISKTFTSSNYADQASGNVDIETKKTNKDNLKASFNYGVNTDVVASDFRVTANNSNINLGYLDNNVNPSSTITNGNWNTLNKQPIGNYGLSISGGKKFDFDVVELKLTASGSHGVSSVYNEGIFREYISNAYKRDFTDVEKYTTTQSTTGLLDLSFKFPGTGQKFSYNSLYVNKGLETLYEQGRSGQGRVLDQFDENDDYGSFSRDQNFQQTSIFVNQLHGSHKLYEANTLTWSAGLNTVNAEEPNRIRNEVNIWPDDSGTEIISDTTFEQRKSVQNIEDKEINFHINDEVFLSDFDSDDTYKVNIGYNFRNKERDFSSTFYGLTKVSQTDRLYTSDFDNLSSILNQESIDNNILSVSQQEENIYSGVLNINAFYTNLYFEKGKFSGNVGVRYEKDKIDMSWDVTNGGVGETDREYDNILPSLNVKYALEDTQNLRLALSMTNTLPEFKEISRFVYISPSGRGIVGNEDLEKSDNFNADLKYEFFPSSNQVLSGAIFGKYIINPINKTIEKGSRGFLTYDNTSEFAIVAGAEIEGKLGLFENDNYQLNSSFNFTYMYTDQSLNDEYQFSDVTNAKLQGASDFIGNIALTLESGSEDKKLTSTLAANYASDKIAVVGGSTNSSASSSTLFNNHIIEKGFVTLDFVLSKYLEENLKVSLTAKNILNPTIQQTQVIKTRLSEDELVVSEYKNGSVLTLGLSYSF